MVIMVTDPTRTDEDRSRTAARILDLALEIIHVITGEDYKVVKNSAAECVTPCVAGGWSSTQSPFMKPRSPIHEQKILELTSRMTKLLTGEVPIRCQDVAVYFSMEEWEHLEGHKDLYKDVMEDQPPLTSPDGSSRRNPPERCPRPLYSQNIKEEEPEIPLDYELVYKQESHDGETSGLEKPKSESMTDEDSMSSPPGHLLLPPHHEDDDHPSAMVNNRPGPGQDKTFACSECGKHFKKKSYLSKHEIIHMDERPFSCSECGKSFRKKSHLSAHQRTHTGEKPYSCFECRKCFARKPDLVAHERIHTGEKPFSCAECGKSFNQKSHLVVHQKTHPGEKPFSCSECGKSFTRKSDLAAHRKTHTGKKLLSCLQCGKWFTRKTGLVEHRRIHTGTKPFSCPECGKSFNRNSCLADHMRTHMGEKPYSCSVCGKGFNQKGSLKKHQKTHSEEEQ